MADKPTNPTTNPMYPQVEYVRVERGNTRFTTARSSVTDDMKVLDDVDALDKRGNPLPPELTKTASGSSKKSTSGTAAAQQPQEG